MGEEEGEEEEEKRKKVQVECNGGSDEEGQPLLSSSPREEENGKGQFDNKTEVDLKDAPDCDGTRSCRWRSRHQAWHLGEKR